ncbi:type VII secretion-associated protein [Actinokineospora enzanensis]|uniref:type VII secretion-associated protein n=1 Tax=Actinokineospora enzanensis TaxID=155975 RepID=UPI00037EB8F2|nr:type VII secretion-associated protein [Actinokineospora enzanensis]
MSLRAAIDFGTSSTCIAISRDLHDPQVVVVDGNPLLSSAIYAALDGTLFVGQEADRQAALDPSRYEPHPKRRIDESELLLGNTVIPVSAIFRAVLQRATDEARRVTGNSQIDQLVLTHPADWGGFRTQTLRQAATGLSPRVILIPEPVAAAVHHAATFPGPPGRTLAILDLGGGTTDVSVVRTEATGMFTILSTKGNPSFGGADVDQLLLDHLGATVGGKDPEAWRALLEGRDITDRRRRRVLHQDVRSAKETLSRHNYADIPLPSPFPDAHVTRPDLERIITGPIATAADLTLAAISAAGLAPRQLAGVFLVGGSSRIPLVAQVVADRTGIVPVTLDQPETVVARGALRAVSPTTGVDHTGLLTGSRPATRPSGPPPVGTAFPTVTPAVPVPVIPPKPNRRRRWLGIAGVTLVAAIAAVLIIVLGRDDPAQTIARYEYRFTLPADWTQTGGNPGLMRTDLKPTGAERGDDQILVQERELSFDSTADRARAVDRLRDDYTQGGDVFSEFDDKASFAGRDVIHYRERASNATVDWYVLLSGRYQVSIGCQYTPDGLDRVRQACAAVVRSMVVSG